MTIHSQHQKHRGDDHAKKSESRPEQLTLRSPIEERFMVVRVFSKGALYFHGITVQIVIPLKCSRDMNVTDWGWQALTIAIGPAMIILLSFEKRRSISEQRASIIGL